MTKEQVKQELLKYYPNKEEAKEILKGLGLSDEECEKLTSCGLDEILVYEAAHRVIDVYAKLADIVLEKYAKLLNVQDNRFSFKTEFLFRALYFLKKKAYGQYIIEREGELIQEIAKANIGEKSDVPELTNQMIDHLIKVIMYTNADQSKIMIAISQWETKFRDLLKQRSTSVCVPCGFNKELKEYNTIPDCVRGMLLYNELVKQEVFKPGTKGFKVYVKNIKFEKLGYTSEQFAQLIRDFKQKYYIDRGSKKAPDDKILLKTITIPQDYETIPDWIEIDTNTFMDKVFRSKANEVLEPLGIKVTNEAPTELLDLF